MRLFTIGVYGSTKQSFFAALQAAKVDLFVDVRRRRGLRGKTYAYANATALKKYLKELGIEYLHLPDLAPTQEAIASQGEADKRAGVARRARQELDPGFVKSYEHDCLANLDPAGVREQLGHAKRPVLFCVEETPGACHRSLLADRLAPAWRGQVQHLVCAP